MQYCSIFSIYCTKPVTSSRIFISWVKKSHRHTWREEPRPRLDFFTHETGRKHLATNQNSLATAWEHAKNAQTVALNFHTVYINFLLPFTGKAGYFWHAPYLIFHFFPSSTHTHSISHLETRCGARSLTLPRLRQLTPPFVPRDQPSLQITGCGDDSREAFSSEPGKGQVELGSTQSDSKHLARPAKEKTLSKNLRIETKASAIWTDWICDLFKSNAPEIAPKIKTWVQNSWMNN